jgi:hypothetical protein
MPGATRKKAAAARHKKRGAKGLVRKMRHRAARSAAAENTATTKNRVPAMPPPAAAPPGRAPHHRRQSEERREQEAREDSLYLSEFVRVVDMVPHSLDDETEHRNRYVYSGYEDYEMSDRDWQIYRGMRFYEEALGVLDAGIAQAEARHGRYKAIWEKAGQDMLLAELALAGRERRLREFNENQRYI